MEKRMVALVEKDKEEFKVDWERRDAKPHTATCRTETLQTYNTIIIYII